MRSWREKEEFSGRRGGDCEWNRDPFDTPLQKPSFADVQTSYLHLYPPSGLDGGLRMSWNSGDGRGGGVCVYLYRGESSGERWIYPDTEIFASMLSTITHRRNLPRRDEQYFKRLLGVTCIGLRACAPTRIARVARTRARENQSSCTYMTRLLACVQTRHWWLEFSWNSSRTCFILLLSIRVHIDNIIRSYREFA